MAGKQAVTVKELGQTIKQLYPKEYPADTPDWKLGQAFKDEYPDQYGDVIDATPDVFPPQGPMEASWPPLEMKKSPVAGAIGSIIPELDEPKFPSIPGFPSIYGKPPAAQPASWSPGEAVRPQSAATPPPTAKKPVVTVEDLGRALRKAYPGAYPKDAHDWEIGQYAYSENPGKYPGVIDLEPSIPGPSGSITTKKPEERPEGFLGKANALGEQFTRAVNSGVVSMVGGGAGGALKAIGDVIERAPTYRPTGWRGGEPANPGRISDAVTEAGELMSTAADVVGQWAAPPEYAQGDPLQNPEVLLEPMWWANVAGNTTGSMAAFMVPGMAVSKGLQAAIKAKNASPAMIAAVEKYGAPVLSGAMEASAEAALVYDEAKKFGASPAEAAKAAAAVFAINVILNPITNKLGVFGEKANSRALGVIMGSLSESTQEVVQKFTSNAAAKFNYDPEQNLFEGVGESLVAGAIGGIGGRLAVNGKPRPPAVPERFGDKYPIARLDAGLPDIVDMQGNLQVLGPDQYSATESPSAVIDGILGESPRPQTAQADIDAAVRLEEEKARRSDPNFKKIVNASVLTEKDVLALSDEDYAIYADLAGVVMPEEDAAPSQEEVVAAQIIDGIKQGQQAEQDEQEAQSAEKPAAEPQQAPVAPVENVAPVAPPEAPAAPPPTAREEIEQQIRDLRLAEEEKQAKDPLTWGNSEQLLRAAIAEGPVAERALFARFGDSDPKIIRDTIDSMKEDGAIFADGETLSVKRAAPPALPPKPIKAEPKKPTKPVNPANRLKPDPPSFPRGLEKAAPRYRDLKLTFESTIDAAAVITAQKNKSKRDADFLKFAMENTGLTEEQIRAHGKQVLNSMKRRYQDFRPGETMHVPRAPRPTAKKAAPQKPPAQSDQDSVQSDQQNDQVINSDQQSDQSPDTGSSNYRGLPMPDPKIAAMSPERQAQEATKRPPNTRQKPVHYGNETTILIPNTSRKIKARYALKHIDDQIDSVDGVRLSKNPRHTLGNERTYKDKSTLNLIQEHGKPGKWDSNYFLTDAKTPTDGPSMRLPNDQSVGGNSRGATLQYIRSEQPEIWAQYQKDMKAAAIQFGFPAEVVNSLEDYTLEREITDELAMSDVASLIADLNVPSTGALTSAERGVAGAKRMSAETRAAIAESLDKLEDGTLREALSRDGVDILNRLVVDGVVPENTSKKYGGTNTLTGKWELNSEGKSLIEQISVAGFTDSVEELEALTASMKAILARIAPSVFQLEEIEGWGLRDEIRSALELISRARAMESDNLEDVANQKSLLGDDRTYTDREIALARRLNGQPSRAVVEQLKAELKERNDKLAEGEKKEELKIPKVTPNQIVSSFREHVRNAKDARSGQMDLMGNKKEMTEEASFVASFVRGDPRSGSVAVPQFLRDFAEKVNLNPKIIGNSIKSMKRVHSAYRMDIGYVFRLWHSANFVGYKHKDFKRYVDRRRVADQEHGEVASGLFEMSGRFFNLPEEKQEAVYKKLIEGRKKRTREVNLAGLDQEQINAIIDFRKAFDETIAIKKDYAANIASAGKVTSAKGIKTVHQAYEALRRGGMGKDQAQIQAKALIESLEAIDNSYREGYVPFSRFGSWGFGFRKVDTGGQKALPDVLDGAKAPGKREGFEHWQTEEGFTSIKAWQEFYKAKEKYADRIASGELEAVEPQYIVKNGSDLSGLGMADIEQLMEVSKMDPVLAKQVSDVFGPILDKRGHDVHFRKSEDVAGFSEDLKRATADYFLSLSRQVSRGKMLRDMSRYKISRRKPRLRAYADEYVKYISSPAHEAGWFRGLLFHWYLGFRFKSAVINTTQVPFITAPWLMQYATTGKVTKEIAKAYKDWGAALSLNAQNGTLVDFSKLPADVRADVIKSLNDGTLRAQMLQELGEYRRGRRSKKGNKTKMLVDASGRMFGEAEVTNRLVTFIAAYRIYQANPVEGFSSASEFAEDVVVKTQFEYGKGNRAIMMRGPVLSSLMTFKAYQQQKMEVWQQLFHESKDKPRARKALLAMLAGQVIASGFMGLPFATMVAILASSAWKAATGEELDFEVESQKWLADLTNEEMAEFLVKGGLRRTGVEISGSLSDGDPFGVEDITRGQIAQTSAPGSLVSSLVTGVFGAITGDTKAMEKLGPGAAQPYLKAYRYAREGLTDTNGKPIALDKSGRTEFTNAELWKVRLDFLPTSVARAYERRRETSALRNVSTEAQSKFLERFAKAIIEEKKGTKGAETFEDVWKDLKKYNSTRRDEHQIVPPSPETIDNRINQIYMDPNEREIQSLPGHRREAGRKSVIPGFYD
jgi:hypothetical protein